MIKLDYGLIRSNKFIYEMDAEIIRLEKSVEETKKEIKRLGIKKGELWQEQERVS